MRASGDKSNFRWIYLLAILTFIALFLAYDTLWGSNSPNYYSVRKAATSFEVPAEWQNSGVDENRGTLGLWCFQVSGGLCPYYEVSYSGYLFYNKEDTIELLQELAQQNGYEVTFTYTAQCNDVALGNGKLHCFVDGKKGNKLLSLGVESINRNGDTRVYVQVER